MKLVLSENIRGLGSTGQVVTVRDGYGRNYLLPKRLAVFPTVENVKRLQKERGGYLLQERGRIEAADILAGKMDELVLEIKMKANDVGQLFGSVTEAIVAEKLTAAIGAEIHPQTVILGSHYKKIGEYIATIRLHSEVEKDIRLMVVAEESEEEMEERLATAAAAAEGEGDGESAEGAEGEAVPVEEADTDREGDAG